MWHSWWTYTAQMLWTYHQKNSWLHKKKKKAKVTLQKSVWSAECSTCVYVHAIDHPPFQAKIIDCGPVDNYTQPFSWEKIGEIHNTTQHSSKWVHKARPIKAGAEKMNETRRNQVSSQGLNNIWSSLTSNIQSTLKTIPSLLHAIILAYNPSGYRKPNQANTLNTLGQDNLGTTLQLAQHLRPNWTNLNYHGPSPHLETTRGRPSLYGSREGKRGALFTSSLLHKTDRRGELSGSRAAWNWLGMLAGTKPVYNFQTAQEIISKREREREREV